MFDNCCRIVVTGDTKNLNTGPRKPFTVHSNTVNSFCYSKCKLSYFKKLCVGSSLGIALGLEITFRYVGPR